MPDDEPLPVRPRINDRHGPANDGVLVYGNDDPDVAPGYGIVEHMGEEGSMFLPSNGNLVIKQKGNQRHVPRFDWPDNSGHMKMAPSVEGLYCLHCEFYNQKLDNWPEKRTLQNLSWHGVSAYAPEGPYLATGISQDPAFCLT